MTARKSDVESTLSADGQALPASAGSPFVVLSLGAGVQSSALALMAAAGEIGPMPKCAIFADTQAEPKAVYEQLAYLAANLPFPVLQVTAGNLTEQILAATRGEQRMDARPPFFVSTGGMLNRQCTQDFKLLPIHKKLRELAGLKPRQRAPKTPVITMWIGISLDEVGRMKPSRLSFVEHAWPLIDRRMSRHDCLRWLKANGHPTPPKSACTFCPYHDNRLWRTMRDTDPAAWAEAVAVDAAIRNGVKNRENGKPLATSKWYVHRSMVPLDQVDLTTDQERGQGDLFGNECEGMCGV